MNTKAPLPERLRPQNFEDLIGQEHLTRPDSPFRKMIDAGDISSFVLWGPPGCGKTTIARIISKMTNVMFYHFSAVSSGIPDLKKIVEETRGLFNKNKKSIVFVDEIHHFNKTQQDFLLPYVEDATLTLIAATTENPSFHINSALLSRLNVFVLYPLERPHLEEILKKAIGRMGEWSGKNIEVSLDAVETIISAAGMDARIALNILEHSVITSSSGNLGKEDIEELIKVTTFRYDKRGEEHYNQISALHKSLRGSDPDAALYWAERMLQSGEDPRFLVRRLIRFACEDVGLADPNALNLAVSVKSTYDFLGTPEGELAILELVVYLALAPKSNTVYKAEMKLKKAISETGYLEVPFVIRNAPTELMKDLGYGKDYEYSHEFPFAVNAQDYLPEALKDTVFYFPNERGYEEKLKKRLEFIKKVKKDIRNEKGN